MAAPAPVPAPRSGPLYKDVKRQLLDALTDGEWKAGTAIPSERQLAARYGISIGTVRKAIDELVANHILIRQQGRGTYVNRHDRDRLLFHFFHIVPEQGPKQYPQVRLLSFARARAERTAAQALQLEPGAPVLRIRNALSFTTTPVMIDDITLPAARFPGLTEQRFRNRPSTVYNLYQEAFGISVVRTSERLRAVVADPAIATLLAVPPGTPLLQIRRLALAYNDLPVELRLSHVNTTHHEYFSDLQRN